MKISNKPSQVTETIAALFILLFTYTAVSKLIDHVGFRATLSTSPLLIGVANFISYALPIIELIIAVLLFFPFTRKVGLKFSLLLMATFTGYLLYMIYFIGDLPCSCGGVISTMTWKEHILFNVGFIVLAAFGLHSMNRDKLFIAINRQSRTPV